MRPSPALLVAALVTLAACGGSTGDSAPAPRCASPSECPGADTECQTRTCAGGTCGLSYAADAVVVTSQAAGDCHVNRCDGAGGVHAVVDETDVPTDDGDPCTLEACSGGTPHPPAPARTACDRDGGALCDGAGRCVACVLAADCPAGGPCQVARCDGGVCGFDPAPVQTLAAGLQTPGDCQALVCDGASQVARSVVDGTDLPVDGEECTHDVCTDGAPSNPPRPAGAACGQGGPRCDAAGRCVQCLQGSDCGTDTACRTFTCDVGGVCGSSSLPAGTVVDDPTQGDCRSTQCDANGGVVVGASDASDVPPDDGNQCTREVCTSGAPQHPYEPAGIPCNQNGGVVCDGAGACVACVAVDQCPPAGGECQVARCSAGTCGFAPAAAQVLAMQDPADCRTRVCDGVSDVPGWIPDDSDVPDDLDECTTDRCDAGASSHLPVLDETPCSLGICQGGVCVPAP